MLLKTRINNLKAQHSKLTDFVMQTHKKICSGPCFFTPKKIFVKSQITSINKAFYLEGYNM